MTTILAVDDLRDQLREVLNTREAQSSPNVLIGETQVDLQILMLECLFVLEETNGKLLKELAQLNQQIALITDTSLEYDLDDQDP